MARFPHPSPHSWPVEARAPARGFVTAAAVLLAVSCGDGRSHAQNAASPPLPPAPAGTRPAFPGAEGHGRLAQGGRGGRIIAVTSLADGGPGTLRACIDASGPRVCVFRVAGVIRYTAERPIIRNPFITIAGETAPGGGILITHSGGPSGLTPLVIKNSHDVIVRHLRVRIDQPGEQRASNDGILIENSRNVIVDHVSASWAQDENFNGHRQNDAITVSWSIFAEGVPRHDKCALLGSDPAGPQRVSFIRNLCAHNGDRNPDVNFTPGSCVEIVNNVFYNAVLQFTEVWESYGGSPVAIVGNYYRRGPDTARGAFTIDRQLVASRGRARIFQNANVSDGADLIVAPSVAEAEVPTPPCPLASDPVAAPDAYRAVLAGSGAFPRDAVDLRIVEEVRTRGGGIGRDNRTLPSIDSGRRYADEDADGMSDAWERAHGSDPAAADPWADANNNGWANLDEFLDHAHHQRLIGRAPA